MSVVNLRSGEVIASQVTVAQSFGQRLKGLMGTDWLSADRGMLFPRTNAVHMCFMRYPLCVLYLTRELVVLRVVVIRPWRIGPVVKGAYWVLELPDSAAAKVLAADALAVSLASV